MSVRILIGDVMEKLAGLPDESVQCCVTSPPYYGLRDYGTASWEGGDADCDHQCSTGTQGPTGQRADRAFTAKVPYKEICGKCGAVRIDQGIGLEVTPEAHIARLVEVFREVRRVLRADGVLWLNYGDAYASTVNGRSAADTKAAGNDDRTFRDKPVSTVGHGAKPKDLLMLPARVALALQADGWWLRSALPWVKRSAMPESVTDRPATAIEYVFLLTKSARYFYDAEAVRQEGAESTLKMNPRYAKISQEKPYKSNSKSAPKEVKRGIYEELTYFTGSRNFRNSDLFYASLAPPHGLICAADGEPPYAEASGGRPLALDVNPAGFAEAHFATFAPRLIEPLIKAGSSEKGCCPACGAPWVREVETRTENRSGSGKAGNPITGKGHPTSQVRNGHDVRNGPTAITKTLGWSPSCDCENSFTTVADDPVPCTVLDPFGGAGTTGLVADRLGRDAVLIELNPDYAAMARKRIDSDAATRGAGPAPVMRGDDLPLFQDSGIRDQASILRQAQDEGDQESDGGLSSEALAKEEP